MMDDYQIITDSNTDLTQEQVDRLDISVIPMSVNVGEDSLLDYPDEREMPYQEFYRRIAAGEICTTNQISLVTFTEAFEPFLAAGQDVLYIGFSSGLSGTYNNSVVAAQELAEKYPQRKIFTVDTLAASMGEGLLVYHAAMKRLRGASIEEVKEWVEQNRTHMHHWFTVDDLNHLKRGGRISGASALVGTMLGIKPVMHFDNQGHIILMEKIRGRRQSLDALVNHMEKTCIHPERQMIFISHSDSQDGCDYVARQIRKRLGVKQIKTAPIGPVIGSHTGTGTVALFYLGQDRELKEE